MVGESNKKMQIETNTMFQVPTSLNPGESPHSK